MPSQAGAGAEKPQGKTSQSKEGGRTKITQICQVRRVLAQKNFNGNSYCCDLNRVRTAVQGLKTSKIANGRNEDLCKDYG
jgi:hypothetical protein